MRKRRIIIATSALVVVLLLYSAPFLLWRRVHRFEWEGKKEVHILVDHPIKALCYWTIAPLRLLDRGLTGTRWSSYDRKGP